MYVPLDLMDAPPTPQVDVLEETVSHGDGGGGAGGGGGASGGDMTGSQGPGADRGVRYGGAVVHGGRGGGGGGYTRCNGAAVNVGKLPLTTQRPLNTHSFITPPPPLSPSHLLRPLLTPPPLLYYTCGVWC